MKPIRILKPLEIKKEYGIPVQTLLGWIAAGLLEARKESSSRGRYGYVWLIRTDKLQPLYERWQVNHKQRPRSGKRKDAILDVVKSLPPADWLTNKQIADILSVGVRTVNKYIRDGKLKAVCFGSKKIRRSSREHLLEFAKQE